jgi:hypothetical protein
MTMYITGDVYARTWEGPEEEDDEDEDQYTKADTTRYPLGRVEVSAGMNTALEHKQRAVAQQYPASVGYEVAVHRRLMTPAGVDTWGLEHWRHIWLAAFDGKGEPKGRHFEALLKDLTKMFPDKRLYVYDTGSSYHGYINTTLDQMALHELDYLLCQHDRAVDVPWLERGGGLRWTKGYRRPEPKLSGWHNL